MLTSYIIQPLWAIVKRYFRDYINFGTISILTKFVVMYLCTMIMAI